MRSKIDAHSLNVVIDPRGESRERITALAHRLIDEGFVFTNGAVLTVTIPLRAFYVDVQRMARLNALIEQVDE